MSASPFAISDLHVSYEENRRIAEALEPETDEDWLIVAATSVMCSRTSNGPQYRNFASLARPTHPLTASTPL